MSIKFDSQACILALRQELIFTMKQLQTELLNEAKQRMNTPEGRESLTDGDIEDIANVISVSIVGGAWAAMDEHGKGSQSDLSNPALQDYIGGDLWNPARGSDMTIRTRPAGVYTNIFGEQVVSHSSRAGFNLEQLGGKYSPMPPSNAIRNAARWMGSFRIKKVIYNTLNSFNYGKYLKVDTR